MLVIIDLLAFGLIVYVTGAAGFAVAKGFTERPRQLADLCPGLEVLRTEIVDAATPLATALGTLRVRAPMGEFFARAGEGIAGAGQVTVMLTLSDAGESKFVTDREETRRSTDTTTEETLSLQTVLLQGGGRESGLKLRETMPEVQGVVVIASGARIAEVREMLTEAAVTILALPPHRVTVLPGR